MSPTGRDAIQEGRACEEAEPSQTSNSAAELNKFIMKHRERDGTGHAQGWRNEGGGKGCLFCIDLAKPAGSSMVHGR